jgi:hypothetical protein
VAVSTSGQLGLSLVILTLFGAQRKLVEGDFDAAEAVYNGVTRQMAERGGANAEAMGMLGRFVVRLARGNVRDSLDELAFLWEHVPNDGTAELYAAALAAAGELEAARRIWRPASAHSLDYYWLLWEGLRAQTAVALLLGDLARLMGQDTDQHYARAEEIAKLVGSPHWARAARERRGHLP